MFATSPDYSAKQVAKELKDDEIFKNITVQNNTVTVESKQYNGQAKVVVTDPENGTAIIKDENGNEYKTITQNGVYYYEQIIDSLAGYFKY